MFLIMEGSLIHTKIPYMRHKQGEILLVNFNQISISANREILMIMMI
jgi:hypothetical protein